MERKDVLREIKNQLHLAGPMFIVGLLQFSLQLISLIFVGRLGELALSGASMANSFATTTGFVLLGLASGLDTLCGHSFGAKEYHMLGIHTQRAILVLSGVSVFLAIIWANTKSILIAMHQDPATSKEAGTYACFMIPSLFAYGILQCLLSFLQTQKNVIPIMLSSVVTVVLHVLLCWILVFKSGLQSRGAALATSISYWMNVLQLLLYLKFSTSCSKTWRGFRWEALHNVRPFIKIVVPSTVMLCLEDWTFELMILLSGILPNPRMETSVLSICYNTFELVLTIPYGLGCAVSTRVSNELGAGNPRVAHLATSIALYMAISEGILVGLVMVLVRKNWGYVYSNEKEVVKHVATMMPILAVSSFLDAIQTVLSGVAKGGGWQKRGAIVNLASFYLVGIPSSVVLAFVVQLRIKGLWLGIVSALSVKSVLLVIIAVRINWEKQAIEVAEQIKERTPPEDNGPLSAT